MIGRKVVLRSIGHRGDEMDKKSRDDSIEGSTKDSKSVTVLDPHRIYLPRSQNRKVKLQRVSPASKGMVLLFHVV